MSPLGWQRVTTLALMALLAMLGARLIHPDFKEPPNLDSGVFSSCAYHLLRGRVLYKDVWDNKPPVIYALNGLALAAGGDINAVRRLEQVFAALGGVACFLAVYAAFGRRWLAFGSSLFFLYLFYNLPVHEWGNFTEEYAAVFLVVGIAAAVRAEHTSGRGAPLLNGLAGACWTLSVLTKEPFLLSVLPWAVWVLARPGRSAGGRWREGGWLAVGAALPCLAVAAYCLRHGALLGLLDKLVAYNLQFGAGSTEPLVTRWVRALSFTNWVVVSQTVTVRVGAVLGLLAVMSPAFNRRHAWLPLVMLAALMGDFVGAWSSPYRFGHQAMQVVPGFVMLAAAGLAYLDDLTSNAAARRLPVAALFALGLVALDYAPMGRLAAQARRKIERYVPSNPVVTYIREHSTADEPIWVGSPRMARLYLETGRLSPTRYFFVLDFGVFVDTWTGTALDKMRTLRRELEANPPPFIVLTDDAYGDLGYLAPVGIPEWLRENYTLRDRFPEGVLLYERAGGNAR